MKTLHCFLLLLTGLLAVVPAARSQEHQRRAGRVVCSFFSHFMTLFVDTFAPKSHPGKIKTALSTIKTMTRKEDSVGLRSQRLRFESPLAYKANFNRNRRNALIFEGFFFLCIPKFTHVYSNFNATLTKLK